MSVIGTSLFFLSETIMTTSSILQENDSLRGQQPQAKSRAHGEVRFIEARELLNDKAGTVPDWAHGSFAKFAEIVSAEAFPCFFARAAFRRGSLRYLFAGSTEVPGDVRMIQRGIENYLAKLKRLDGREAAFHALVVMIKPVSPPLTIEAYHLQAWTLLQRLHDMDREEWPADIPCDPHDVRFSYCLAGTPLFVNVSTPAHHRRRSRNLGPSLTLIIQPREGFDVVPGSGPRADMARQQIREAAKKYDDQPLPEGIGKYGEECSREWLQYILLEDNRPRTDRCPLVIRRKTACRG